jgi:hypothetical protein
MALTLAEQNKLIVDPLKRGVISTFTETSQVLRFLPFRNVAGNSYKYVRENALPTVGFRDYNEEYTEGSGTTSEVTENLYIFGGVADVDRALIKTQNVHDVRSVQTSMQVKAMARFFEWAFFKSENTSGNDEYFNGLDARITGDQKIDHSGAQLDLDALDELIDQTKGENKVLFMNKKMRRKVNSLVRAAGSAIETVNTNFGVQYQGYAGVPIATVEEDHEGNDILDFTESSGGSTSIYCVSFAPDLCCGLQAGGMEVTDHGLVSGSPLYRIDVEWIASITLFNLKSASRLHDIAEPA